MSETPATKKRRVHFPFPDDSSDSSNDVKVLGTFEPTTVKMTPSAAACAVVTNAVVSHPDSIRDLTVLKATSFNALKNTL